MSKMRRCVTCGRSLDPEIRAGMGLRTGDLLDELCPGLNGPSDVDHVLHNGHSSPERVMFLEYKRGGASMSIGQARLLDALAGNWQDRDTGRLIEVRYKVLRQDVPDDVAITPLIEVVRWLWPPDDPVRRARAA